jgi:hypothetical protein
VEFGSGGGQWIEEMQREEQYGEYGGWRVEDGGWTMETVE